MAQPTPTCNKNVFWKERRPLEKEKRGHSYLFAKSFDRSSTQFVKALKLMLTKVEKTMGIKYCKQLPSFDVQQEDIDPLILHILKCAPKPSVDDILDFYEKDALKYMQGLPFIDLCLILGAAGRAGKFSENNQIAYDVYQVYQSNNDEGFSLSDQLSSYVSNCLLNSFNQKQGVKTAAELCSIVCALPSASDSERESIILRLLGQGYTWDALLLATAIGSDQFRESINKLLIPDLFDEYCHLYLIRALDFISQGSKDIPALCDSSKISVIGMETFYRLLKVDVCRNVSEDVLQRMTNYESIRNGFDALLRVVLIDKEYDLAKFFVEDFCATVEGLRSDVQSEMFPRLMKICFKDMVCMLIDLLRMYDHASGLKSDEFYAKSEEKGTHPIPAFVSLWVDNNLFKTKIDFVPAIFSVFKCLNGVEDPSLKFCNEFLTYLLTSHNFNLMDMCVRAIPGNGGQALYQALNKFSSSDEKVRVICATIEKRAHGPTGRSRLEKPRTQAYVDSRSKVLRNIVRVKSDRLSSSDDDSLPKRADVEPQVDKIDPVSDNNSNEVYLKIEPTRCSVVEEDSCFIPVETKEEQNSEVEAPSPILNEMSASLSSSAHVDSSEVEANDVDPTPENDQEITKPQEVREESGSGDQEEVFEQQNYSSLEVPASRQELGDPVVPEDKQPDFAIPKISTPEALPEESIVSPPSDECVQESMVPIPTEEVQQEPIGAMPEDRPDSMVSTPVEPIIKPEEPPLSNDDQLPELPVQASTDVETFLEVISEPSNVDQVVSSTTNPETEANHEPPEQKAPDVFVDKQIDWSTVPTQSDSSISGLSNDHVTNEMYSSTESLITAKKSEAFTSLDQLKEETTVDENTRQDTPVASEQDLTLQSESLDNTLVNEGSVSKVDTDPLEKIFDSVFDAGAQPPKVICEETKIVCSIPDDDNASLSDRRKSEEDEEETNIRTPSPPALDKRPKTVSKFKVSGFGSPTSSGASGFGSFGNATSSSSSFENNSSRNQSSGFGRFGDGAGDRNQFGGERFGNNRGRGGYGGKSDGFGSSSGGFSGGNGNSGGFGSSNSFPTGRGNSGSFGSSNTSSGANGGFGGGAPRGGGRFNNNNRGRGGGRF